MPNARTATNAERDDRGSSGCCGNGRIRTTAFGWVFVYIHVLGMQDNSIEPVFDALLAYCEQRDWSGYDPYDALRSPLLRMLSFGSRWPRIAWIQLLKRSPVNLRPLLVVPKGINPKGLGLAARALVAESGVEKNVEHLVQGTGPCGRSARLEICPVLPTKSEELAKSGLEKSNHICQIIERADPKTGVVSSARVCPWRISFFESVAERYNLGAPLWSPA